MEFVDDADADADADVVDDFAAKDHRHRRRFDRTLTRSWNIWLCGRLKPTKSRVKGSNLDGLVILDQGLHYEAGHSGTFDT